MTHIINIYYKKLILFIILFLLFTGGCDSFHSVKYSVNLSKTRYGDSTLENVESKNLIISMIEKIAFKYNMEKEIHDEYYYFFGDYQYYKVRILLVFKNEYLIIEVSDFFRSSQSEISKAIQKEIIDAIKIVYGNEAVIQKGRGMQGLENNIQDIQ